MTPYRILIVEDEVLIADTIERYLNRKGYEVVGKAISYEEAKSLYQAERPDLIILDIHLSGVKTGIDFAQYLQEAGNAVPFIFLTSQFDSRSVQAAKATFPSGYLAKPIQRGSLYATIEIAMYSHQVQDEEKETVRLSNGRQYYQVLVDDILYLRVDHVYVKVTLRGKEEVVQRGSLKEMISQLPAGQFVQTHRSYAVNIEQVTSWGQEYIYVLGLPVPISRSRRSEVLSLLEKQSVDT